MSERILTIDLGNSRCKLCVFEGEKNGTPRVIDEVGFATGPALAREVAAFARQHTGTRVVALSCVGPIDLESEVAAVLSDAYGAQFQHNPDPQLDIECSPAGAVGRDRVYAARGAIERSRSGAVVVDAGTALTVDAVAPGSARARFLGGSIAPGPHLLADALARHAARLPLVVPRPGVHVLGRDTQAALQAGIVVGFRGAARELARLVARESGLESAPIVVTGGARAFLLEPVPCFDAVTIEEPNLVHHGLAWAATARR